MLCRELNFLVCFYEINKIYICANLAVYPGSDNVPDEILSISGEIEPVGVDTFRNEKKDFRELKLKHREVHNNLLSHWQTMKMLVSNWLIRVLHLYVQNRQSNPLNLFEPLESFEEKPPLELPTETRLKVRIKRLKMIGEWRWIDGKDDNCGICRTSFETCCVDCKFPGDDCPLVTIFILTVIKSKLLQALGACTHAFHMHCIVKWTNAQNGQKPVCPLCRQEWKFAS